MIDSPRPASETPHRGRAADKAMGSTNLVELLRWRAQRQPDQVAQRYLLDGDGEQIERTYGELDLRARAIAARLQRDGAAGERVLLLYPAGPEFLLGFFGCLYAGAIAVPAYPPRRRGTDPRIAEMAADCAARFALTTSPVLTACRSRLTGAADADDGDLDWVASDEVASELAGEWRPPSVRPEDLAVLQYTSGSTSTPKGVMVSHHNVLSNSVALDEALAHDADSVILSWLPHFHDMGLIYGLLHPLYQGVLGVQMSPASFIQQPLRWLQAITRHRATHSGGPNFAYELCVKGVPEQMRSGLDLSRWRIAFNGAEPVRRETLERFHRAYEPSGLRWITQRPCYGLAEATLKVTFCQPHEKTVFARVRAADLELGRVVPAAEDEPDARVFVGCGSAAADTRVAIVDPESRHACPPDRVGEIWVSGSSVTQGYWNRADESRQTFAAHRADNGEGPYLRTGDLGFVSAGQLFVTGRIKDLIIIRGLNHYPQDIELTVERAHPALRPGFGASFAVDRGGEEQLVVAQELDRQHRDVDLEEVLARVRTAVTAEHDIEPSAIVLLRQGSLPKTSSGKIQRFACRERYLAGDLPVVAEWRAPRAREAVDGGAAGQRGEGASPQPPSADEIRRWLVARISAESGLDARAVDLRRPFAQFGLDSLKALALVGELERWLGRRLPATMLWNFPTIDALAVELARGAGDGGGGAEPPGSG